MVRDTLAIPATGAGVERQFSRSGRIMASLRRRLSPETVYEIMMYKNHLARKKQDLDYGKTRVRLWLSRSNKSMRKSQSSRNGEITGGQIRSDVLGCKIQYISSTSSKCGKIYLFTYFYQSLTSITSRAERAASTSYERAARGLRSARLCSSMLLVAWRLARRCSSLGAWLVDARRLALGSSMLVAWRLARRCSSLGAWLVDARRLALGSSMLVAWRLACCQPWRHFSPFCRWHHPIRLWVRLALTSAGKRCTPEFVDGKCPHIALARLPLYKSYKTGNSWPPIGFMITEFRSDLRKSTTRFH